MAFTAHYPALPRNHVYICASEVTPILAFNDISRLRQSPAKFINLPQKRLHKGIFVPKDILVSDLPWHFWGTI